MNLRSAIPLLLTIVPASAGMGQDLRAADLVGNSPFLPPDHGQQQQAQNGPAVSESDLEYRGMYSLGDRYYFNVYNKRENKGKWLTLNDEVEGLSVTSFDLQQDRVSIRINGRNETLAMSKPSAGSLPVELATNSGSANRRVLPANANDNNNRPNPRVVRRTVPSRVVNRTVPPPPPAVLQRSGAGSRPVPPPAVRTQGNVGGSSFGYGPTTGANIGNRAGVPSQSPSGSNTPQPPASAPPAMQSPGEPPQFIPEIPDFVKNGMVPPSPPPSGPPPGAPPQ